MSQFCLLWGDCLEKMDLIADDSIDLVLTDPPYGTTQCQWDTVIPFAPMWKQLRRIIKPRAAWMAEASAGGAIAEHPRRHTEGGTHGGGAIVLMSNQPFTSDLIRSNPATKDFKYTWTWEKSNLSNFLNAKKMPMRCVEDINVFYAEQCQYNPQGLVRCESVEVNWNHEDPHRGETLRRTYNRAWKGYPRNLLKIASEVDTVHPTQKPVELMEYLIRTYTNEGDTVLDFAMGSGTTGVAALRTGRRFIGIEQDLYYLEIGRKRILDATKY